MTHSPISPEFLARLEPMSRMSEQSTRELAEICRRDRVARGQVLSEPGPDGRDALYVVKGEVLLTSPDDSTEVLVGGTEVARFPLRQIAPAFRSARAITDVELIRVDEDTLDIMTTWDQMAAPLAEAATAESQAGDQPDWRTLSGVFTAHNLTSGLFSALPPAHFEELLTRFHRVPVRRGEVVLREGECGDCYYVIERGRCEVTRQVGGAVVSLAELAGGDAFGEEALLSDSPRNATVTMRSDGVLLRLSKADFTRLLQEPLLRRISLEQAWAKVRAGAVWVDVRFPAEFAADRVPGAINIPLNEIRNAIGSLDPGKEYIVLCQSGRRSSAAAFLMSQRGLRAYLLEGGLRHQAGDAAAAGHADSGV